MPTCCKKQMNYMATITRFNKKYDVYICSCCGKREEVKIA